MAVSTWTNAQGDGDLNVGANYDSGVVPSTGDELLFSARSAGPPTLNMATFTGAGFTLALLYIGDDCTIDVGTKSNPLQVDVITKAVHQGNGALHISCTTIDRVICNSDHEQTTAALHVGNTTTLTALVAVKGRVEIADTVTTVTRVLVSFRSSKFADVVLDIGESSSAIAEYRQVGGTATLNRLPTLASVEDGECVVLETAPAATVTLVEVMGSGRLDYRNPNTIARANVYSGTLDTTGVTNPLTITNVAVWPAGTFLRSDDLVTYGGGAVLDDLTGGDV